MSFWLFSTEPDVFPFSQVEKTGRALWDGIRGPAARKYQREIKAGDQILGYHSSPEKAVVCLAKAATAAFPDPKDEKWLALDVSFDRWLDRPVTLAELRVLPGWSENPFLRIPRLSVAPVTGAQAKALLKKAQGEKNA